jgi:uncharacterized protein (DUF302 family)
MDTVCQRESSLGFEETLEALRASAVDHKWGVLGGYAFSEILEGKGFPQGERMASIDICAPRHANEVVARHPLGALCMPCAVLVYTRGDAVHVAAVRPSAALPAVFGDVSSVAETLDEVDGEIESILDGALTPRTIS